MYTNHIINTADVGHQEVISALPLFFKCNKAEVLRLVVLRLVNRPYYFRNCAKLERMSLREKICQDKSGWIFLKLSGQDWCWLNNKYLSKMLLDVLFFASSVWQFSNIYLKDLGHLNTTSSSILEATILLRSMIYCISPFKKKTLLEKTSNIHLSRLDISFLHRYALALDFVFANLKKWAH